GKSGSSNVNCLFFDEPNNEKIQIIKDQRKCGGIKICSYAHKHIMNNKHTNVDFDLNIFQTIKNAEELQSIQANTISARRLDMRKYKTCETQDKYGITRTGTNNGPIFRAIQSIKRYDKKCTLKKKSTPNKSKQIKSKSTSTESTSLDELERQISLEECRLEIKERKERL
ncbi:6720_t:CDS:2, partial [Dentiscutata erythropus]